MKKHWKIWLPCLLAALVLGALLWKHFFLAAPKAQTTSQSASAQNDYKGVPRTEAQSTNVSQGGATDNHGDNSPAVPSSSGSTSVSGVITVLSPASGDTIRSGSTLRGTAKGLDTIQYRVIDDNRGVIAEGSLSVVDGTYSGSLHFTATATTGRVDVYDFNAAYEEENNVQIPVHFKV